MNASRCENAVAGAGSVGSSAGTYTACTLVMAPPLADAGKDRVTAVGAGDAGDELSEDDRFAEAGPAEQSGLASADEGGQQVDDLDPRFEDLGLGAQVGHLGRLAVNRPALFRGDR